MVRMARERIQLVASVLYNTHTHKQMDTQHKALNTGMKSYTRTRGPTAKWVRATCKNTPRHKWVQATGKDEWPHRHSVPPSLLSTHGCMHPSYFHHTQDASSSHTMTGLMHTQTHTIQLRKETDRDAEGNLHTNVSLCHEPLYFKQVINNVILINKWLRGKAGDV